MFLCQNNQLNCVATAPQGGCNWYGVDYRVKHSYQVGGTLKKPQIGDLSHLVHAGFCDQLKGDLFYSIT